MLLQAGQCCCRLDSVVAGWTVLLQTGQCCCRLDSVVAGWTVLLQAGRCCCRLDGVVAGWTLLLSSQMCPAAAAFETETCCLLLLLTTYSLWRIAADFCFHELQQIVKSYTGLARSFSCCFIVGTTSDQL